jgi:hypothetical protein
MRSINVRDYNIVCTGIPARGTRKARQEMCDFCAVDKGKSVGKSGKN